MRLTRRRPHVAAEVAAVCTETEGLAIVARDRLPQNALQVVAKIGGVGA